MSPFSPSKGAKGPATDVEELRVLREVLLGIEKIALAGTTVEELHRLLLYVHCGSSQITPVFDAGLDVFRAVRVDSKPLYKNRLSYPPQRFVQQNGRLNAAGEVIFYGSVGQPWGTLYECRAKPGELYAIGRWRTTSPIVLNHLGYSSALVNATVPRRQQQSWMVGGEVNSRDAVLRSWQSEAFTRHVEVGDEYLYALTIALGRLAMGEINNLNNSSGMPTEFAGVMYPSISVKLYTDNVALRPAVVDSSLELMEVTFLRIQDIPEVDPLGKNYLARLVVTTLDTALSHRRDGRLVWLRESTALSISPWP